MGRIHLPVGVPASLLLVTVLAAGCGGGGVEPPPPGRTITVNGGGVQNGIAGSAVPIAPSVLVTDADGNAVSGVPVTFQVTSGGGSVVPETPVNTNAQGVAAATSWTLGPAAGSNTLSATSPGLTGSPVVFTATAQATATISGTVTVSGALLSVSRAPLSSMRRRLAPGRSALASPRAMQPRYASNELLVSFRPGSIGAPGRGAASTVSRSAAARIGGEIRNRIAPVLSAHAAVFTGVSPAIATARLQVKDGAELARLSAALRANPAVVKVARNGMMWSAAASRNSIHHRASVVAANDPAAILHAWSHGMIDVPEAWNTTTGSPSVIVAVIADGARFDHPDIAANLTHDGYDFASDPDGSEVPLCTGGSIDPTGDGDGYDPDPTTPTSYFFDGLFQCAEGPEDVAAWGTGHAGIIGAVGNNGIGVSGINWSVRIRPIRVSNIYGGGYSYDLAQGILYAAGLPADDGNGGVVQAPTAARIITVNLLGNEDDPVVRDAVIAATNAGALVIAAVGHFATSDPVYPAGYPEVLATSAVGPDGELAAYSSFGTTIDIAAPGGDFGDGDFSFGIGTTLWDFVAGEPLYALELGTGTAAAHVAGVAALLLAQEPGLTAAALRSRLTDYAVDAGAPGRDDQYGAGILNARNSLAGNLHPPQQLHARLYDAANGRLVQTTAVAADGSYSFAPSPGSYQVFAGQDESTDGQVGLPGRRWGAFGGSARPSRIEVTSPESHQASFAVGFPSEHEPNATAADANTLPVGGYLQGVISAASGADVDVFRVQIADAGEYTFEASGVDGACGFALEENTVLGLYGPDQSRLALSDDIDTEARNFCSRITMSLQPGTHYLWVQGVDGPRDVLRRGGRYRVQARSGS